MAGVPHCLGTFTVRTSRASLSGAIHFRILPENRGHQNQTKSRAWQGTRAGSKHGQMWVPVLTSGLLCGLGRVNFPPCVFIWEMGLRVKEERIPDYLM